MKPTFKAVNHSTDVIITHRGRYSSSKLANLNLYKGARSIDTTERG